MLKDFRLWNFKTEKCPLRQLFSLSDTLKGGLNLTENKKSQAALGCGIFSVRVQDLN
jgi:hypothetical protein